MTDEFIGPIVEVRFVLVDGKRIMQIRRDSVHGWRTPPTVDIGELPQNEARELKGAIDE